MLPDTKIEIGHTCMLIISYVDNVLLNVPECEDTI